MENPKVTYTFILPDNQEEEKFFRNGPKYHSVIWDLLETLRQEYKYGTNKSKTASELREEIHELLRAHEVDHDF
jgi:hypothetical protein